MVFAAWVCIESQARVSNYLLVKKNRRFPGFLTPALLLARGRGGDRRAQVMRPGLPEKGGTIVFRPDDTIAPRRN